MKRFLTVLAATFVAAAIAIPALGANQTPNDDGAQINACLRAHGVDVPADLRGIQLKQWIGNHMAESQACVPDHPDGQPAPEKLIKCLRDNGLNPPSNIDELKPYLASHQDSAALTACGIGRATEAKPGDCGGDKPQTQSEAEAAKRQ